MSERGNRMPIGRFARARAVELPAATCAFTVHRGSYQELALAHRGHETPGALRELYVNEPTEVAEEALVRHGGAAAARLTQPRDFSSASYTLSRV